MSILGSDLDPWVTPPVATIQDVWDAVYGHDGPFGPAIRRTLDGDCAIYKKVSALPSFPRPIA